MICFDPRNPKALEYHGALLEHLGDRELPEELVVTIGGDGFMLRTVAEHGFDRTYLGLNAGHLGFLLNAPGDWESTADALAGGHYLAHEFPLLAATIETCEGEIVEECAVNDVYLERSTGQTARLCLTINDHQVVGSLTADGIIFSTALGSTAYSFSAGGAPCHPTLQALAVTPICPHLPRLSPFLLPATARATVDVQQAHRRPVRAVADGRSVEDVASVRLAMADQTVTLAWLRGHDFTSHLVRKILHP